MRGLSKPKLGAPPPLSVPCDRGFAEDNEPVASEIKFWASPWKYCKSLEVDGGSSNCGLWLEKSCLGQIAPMASSKIAWSSRETTDLHLWMSSGALHQHRLISG